MQDSREIDYFGQRILQIVQPLAATEDRAEVLAALAQSIANNFAADGCWVLQYPSAGVVRVAASACVSHRTHIITPELATATIPPAPTPTQWRTLLLPDYQVIVVDMKDRDRVTGSLVVATKGVEWYRETKLVLQIVSEYVNVALLEEDLQVQAQISQIYPQLHYRLTQAIVEEQPTDRLFEIAVTDMVEALQLKRGLVLTLKSTDAIERRQGARQSNNNSETAPPQPDGGSVEPSATGAQVEQNAPAATAVAQPSAASTQIQIATTIDRRTGNLPPLPPSFLLESSALCQQALANAPNPTILERKNRDSTPIDRLIFQDDRLPSIAMIPLVGSTNPAVWGWLVLQHDRSRHWHPVELKLLQCQVYQIALARIHRREIVRARGAVANRTSQVQTSLQLQAKLHDVGRKQMEKLRKANDLKDEFLQTIGHELRTPLTSMSLAIKMLRQDDLEPERRARYLDILEDQCRQEIELVNNLLKFQQLESKQLEFKPQRIDLNRFIAEQTQLVADRWHSSKSLELALHLPEVSSQIETDADSLKHIIEELSINAGKFALPQSQVEVWLKLEPERALLEIANLSKPISPEDLAHLFDRFRRGTGVTQQAIAGTGLGLALVKSMVDHIQGTITVTSEIVSTDVAKTRFTVTIPTELERN